MSKSKILCAGRVFIDDEDGEIWIGEGDWWLQNLKNYEGKHITIILSEVSNVTKR